jgi:uncharacterized protein
MELRARVALVTGASTGIGEAACREFARRGARVLLVARSADKLESVAAAIRAAGGDARAFATDVGDAAAVAELQARVQAEVGVPDVIVNNAGQGRFLFIDETEPTELTGMTDVPYHAAFFVTRAFIEGMLARRSGWIVNVNTPAAFAPWPGALGYAGARWAVRGFTEALRVDLHGTGIGVSQVVPGKVSSAYFDDNPGAEARIPRISRLIRTLTPEQTADAIVNAVERERGDVFLPFELRLMMLQARLMPGMTRRVMNLTGARRRR